MTYQIFVSYRRADQPAVAELLVRELQPELLGDRVFLDREEIEPGAVFPKHIQRAIEGAPVFLALIGAQWNPLAADGTHRLDDVGDFVRCEVALGLECAAADYRRLFVPVLFDGAKMPTTAELPQCLHRLTTYQALLIPQEQPYLQGLRRLVDIVVRNLDEHDSTPAEEKWILQQITTELTIDRERLKAIGRELTKFPIIGAPPESARAVAWALYRIGPAALDTLLRLGLPDQRITSLLDLLATNWILPRTAQELRATLGSSHAGQKIALECEIADFTAPECLLKASHKDDGWPRVDVKRSDPPREIVQQVHEELANRFHLRLRARSRREREMASLSPEARLKRERDEICELLRKTIREGRELPLVLRFDHRMTLDDDLLLNVQEAFPPLHILVATHDTDELSKIHFAARLTASENDEEEVAAYDAYADALMRIEFRRKIGS
jgi:hypothetical protein